MQLSSFCDEHFRYTKGRNRPLTCTIAGERGDERGGEEGKRGERGQGLKGKRGGKNEGKMGWEERGQKHIGRILILVLL